MLYYTVGQWRVFVFMLLSGAAAGCWYGLIARAGRLMAAGPWLNALLDLLSALGIWLILTAALLIASYGEVRLYALLAAALGFAAERATLARLAARLLNLLGAGGVWIARRCARLRVVKKIFQ